MEAEREVEGGIGKKEIKCSGTRAVLQIKTEEIKAALFKRSVTSIYLSNIREVFIRQIGRLFMKGNNNNIELTLFFVFRYTYYAQWQNQFCNCRRQRR